MENPVDVVVSERFGATMRYHICIDGHGELWEQGNNIPEAIERLQITHPSATKHGIGRVINRGLVTQDLQDLKS